MSYQLLTFFSDSNDQLRELANGFRAGTVSCSDMKKAAAESVIAVLKDFQKTRDTLTAEDVKQFG